MDPEERKAIAVHHTPTSDGPWDGPANEARLKTDQDPEYYRKAYAWQDPEGNPRTKAAYRFIHHEVDSDGNIGAANVRACITGIAVLNGARGGTTIPSADRPGVYRHLAAHIKDAGKEPPELKSLDLMLERRAFSFTPEVRTDNDQPRLVGYAAVFNQVTDLLPGFREVVRRGAFAKSIREGDIRALWNHDPNYVLGRTRSGTLKLDEDEHGLKVEIAPPNTAWARDLLESIKRADVDQMSFGFRVLQDRWTREDTEKPLRELLEVELFDVSPVTFPAYPETEIGVRSAHDVYESYLAAQAGTEDEDIARKQARVSLFRKRLDLIL